jgi:hypothetical protein
MTALLRAILGVSLLAAGAFAQEPAPVDTGFVAARGGEYLRDPETQILDWIRTDTTALGLIQRTIAAKERRKTTATLTTLGGLGVTVLGFAVGFATGDCTEQPSGGTYCESPAGMAIAIPGMVTFFIGVGLFFADTAEEKEMRSRYNIYVMDKRLQ